MQISPLQPFPAVTASLWGVALVDGDEGLLALLESHAWSRCAAHILIGGEGGYLECRASQRLATASEGFRPSYQSCIGREPSQLAIEASQTSLFLSCVRVKYLWGPHASISSSRVGSIRRQSLFGACTFLSPMYSVLPQVQCSNTLPQRFGCKNPASVNLFASSYSISTQCICLPTSR